MNVLKPLIVFPLSILLTACSTGIVQMDANTYMVSVKSAEVGFVTGDGAKADAYKEANEFCQKQSKSVKTLNVSTKGSGLARAASANLEFTCID